VEDHIGNNELNSAREFEALKTGMEKRSRNIRLKLEENGKLSFRDQATDWIRSRTIDKPTALRDSRQFWRYMKIIKPFGCIASIVYPPSPIIPGEKSK